MELNKAIEIMQAAASGKKIQYRSLSGPLKTWTDTDEPKWNWALYEYRVAHEIKPFRSVWDFLYELNQHSAGNHLIREDGDIYEVVNVDMEDNAIKIKLRDTYYGDDDTSWVGFVSLSNHYRFGDNSPCGYTQDDEA